MSINGEEAVARSHSHSNSMSSNGSIVTPSMTDGDTATESEVDTEVDEVLSPRRTALKHSMKQKLSQYDLLQRYFRKDLIGLKNLDLLRRVIS